MDEKKGLITPFFVYIISIRTSPVERLDLIATPVMVQGKN